MLTLKQIYDSPEQIVAGLEKNHIADAQAIANNLNNAVTAFKNAIMMQKADYFKIKDITLAYQLPKNLLKQVLISNARVYCSLKNFFTFSHFDNYDPERGGAVNFPLMKQVVVGLNVTF